MKISFKDLPVFYKQVAFISVILLAVFVGVFHLHSYEEESKRYSTNQVVAAKLLYHSQQVAIQSGLVLSQVKNTKPTLEKELNLFEKYFYTVKNGGEVLGLKPSELVQPPHDDEKKIIRKIENNWYIYKEYATIIYTEETFKAENEMATGTMSADGTMMEDEVQKTPFEYVRKAKNGIDHQHGFIASDIQELIELYSKKGEKTFEKKQRLFIIYLFIILSSIIIYLLLVQFFVINNLIRLKKSFVQILSGSSELEMRLKSKDELGQIEVFLMKILERTNNIVSFVNAVSSGELSKQFKSDSEDDQMAISLNSLLNTLSEAKVEENRRKEEDDIRNWTTQGVAKFGELLRVNTDNLKDLSYNIISNLIEYIDAVQGGIFIIEEKNGEKVFKLLVSYAFDREKFLTKELAWGESLVGRCAQEQKTIFLKEVPDNYLEITSGLGESKPANILLSPLVYNNEIFGVLELASFNDLEEYKIEFVEKVSSSIASTIANVRTNLKTSQLLSESKEQAERLAQQEEEMRQNMEEMQATQEEAGLKNIWLQNIINAVQEVGLYYEIDKAFDIINPNSEYIRISGDESPAGKPAMTFMEASFSDEVEYKKFMNALAKGEPTEKEIVYGEGDSAVWFLERYTPVNNAYDEFEKIIVVGVDVTESKRKNEEMELLLAELATRDGELNDKIENMEALQEELRTRDNLQKKEIEKLIAENQVKLEFISQKEKQSRAILDSSHDSVFVFKGTGAIIFINQQAQKLFNVDAKSVINRDFIGIFSSYLKSTEDITMEKLPSVFDNQTEHTLAIDSVEIPVLISMSKSSGSEGDIYSLFIKDISQIKNREKEREKIYKEVLLKEVKYQSMIETLKESATGANIDGVENTFVVWSSAYEIGNELIDKQHKELVVLLNELFNLFTEGADEKLMVEKIAEIKDLSLLHVDDEETIFLETEYPLAEEHKQKHEMFREQIKSMYSSFEAGEMKVSFEMLHFVKAWVDEHIKEFDQELKKYIDTSSEEVAVVKREEKKEEEAVEETTEKVESDNNVELPLVDVPEDDTVELTVVEWKDEYSNSYKEFDDQHKTLFDLTNQLIRAYLDKKNKRQLKNIAKGLTDYTEYHFATEERKLKEAGYEQLDSHKKEHLYISNVLKSIQDQINSKKQLNATLIQELSSKFCEHFAGLDKTYQDILK